MNALTLPNGITGREPMPYGYRRWNGAVWADIQVDAYNTRLTHLLSMHDAGYSAESLVNGLYNLAHGFDHAAKDGTL